MSEQKNKIYNLFRKAFNKLYGRFIIPLKEKEYVKDGQVIHTLQYYNKQSNILAVGLQAYHPAGPRYGYVSTLSKLNINRLYIKDDFCEPHGDFYLGRNGEYQTEQAVTQLILDEANQLGVKKIILFGSSKGGYAALNIGLNIPNSYIVIAAPQYALGDYLQNTKKFVSVLKRFAGDHPDLDILQELNTHIHNKFKNNYHGQHIYIHYSPVEEGYEPYMEQMFEDLIKYQIPYEQDVKDYTKHNELKYYFPEYLRKTVKEIIDGK